MEHIAGSGLSGDCLTEAGHHWIGCDISKDMLVVAKEQETEGDVVLNDMGQVRERERKGREREKERQRQARGLVVPAPEGETDDRGVG